MVKDFMLWLFGAVLVVQTFLLGYHVCNSGCHCMSQNCCYQDCKACNCKDSCSKDSCKKVVK